MKKFIIIFSVIFTLMLVSCSFAKEFSDVPTEHWAYSYINELSNSNIITGFEDGTYKPNNSVTVAQAVKLMVCTDDYLAKYADTLEMTGPELLKLWYDKYVIAAYEAGKTVLYDDYLLLPFPLDTMADRPITRKEVALMLFNYAKYENILDFSEYVLEGKDAFNDISDCEDKYIDAIDVIKNLGIIIGYDDGSFKPEANITRAEFSKVLSLYIDLLKGGNIK